LADLLDVINHAQRLENPLLAGRQLFEPMDRRQSLLLAHASQRRLQPGRRVGTVLHAGSAAFVFRLAEFSGHGDTQTSEFPLGGRGIRIAVWLVVLEHLPGDDG
jgi:hypothetical protein